MQTLNAFSGSEICSAQDIIETCEEYNRSGYCAITQGTGWSRRTLSLMISLGKVEQSHRGLHGHPNYAWLRQTLDKCWLIPAEQLHVRYYIVMIYPDCHTESDTILAWVRDELLTATEHVIEQIDERSAILIEINDAREQILFKMRWAHIWN